MTRYPAALPETGITSVDFLNRVSEGAGHATKDVGVGGDRFAAHDGDGRRWQVLPNASRSRGER
ncbi:MAG: hypothetical protein AVDCRST_MAG70-2402 [uncultured Thermomicrobiales bacterium]|uniref:Uncharacterized protein n=1 Tax=uncultured Thermomicrobiales bacterium TaxID=1645740 RepID=A0A6J4V6V4_9BACT|nr:MAG: hypothetical protein AVDCRST_MAG70-2402 [uncultured Thermomicrobiales bacterium]